MTEGFLLAADGDCLFPLSASRPPLESGDGTGRLLLWFEGVLFEQGELARSLGLAAAAGGGREADLLAAAWRRFGLSMPAKLSGEYVAVVVDPQQRLLVAGSDAVGIRPLYWARWQGRLLLSSRLPLLLAHIGQPDLLDRYAFEHLAACRHPPGATPYRGVFRLRPGNSLRWANGQAGEEPGWRLDSGPAADAGDKGDAGDRAEEFRHLARRAVRASIGDKGAITAAELSGGLDSSTIAALSWGEGEGRRPAALFSVIYSQSAEADERPWMRALLADMPYRHLTVDGDVAAPFSRLPRNFLAEPGSAAIFAAYAHAYEDLARQHGISRLLSGNGGDHVLYGEQPEPLFLADLLAAGRLPALFAAARRWQAGPEQRPWGFHLWHHAVRPLAARWRGAEVTPRTLPPLPPWIEAGFAGRHRRRLSHASHFVRAAPTVAGQYFAERVERFHEGVPNGLQQEITAVSYGYPLLFRPLVEFLARQPQQRMIRPEVDRLLQRRALRGVLPEAIRLRQGKRGPDEAVFRGLRNAPEWLDLLASRPQLAERGYVDRWRWEQTMVLARAGQMQAVSLFLQAATLEYWLRNLTRLRTMTPPLLQPVAGKKL